MMKLKLLRSTTSRPVGRAFLCLLLLTGTPRLLPADETVAVTRKIQPGDTLIIQVDEPDIGKVEKKVDAEGKITFHFLGEIDAKEKTTAELEKFIRNGLDKDWIVNPNVSVVVALYSEKVVSVNGFVLRPGPVKIPPDRRLSLIEAISTAGDVVPRGNRKKVQLSRKGVITYYNLKELAKEKDADKQVYLEPDDVITVPQVIF